jgi:hypothetical protein
MNDKLHGKGHSWTYAFWYKSSKNVNTKSNNIAVEANPYMGYQRDKAQT